MSDNAFHVVMALVVLGSGLMVLICALFIVWLSGRPVDAEYKAARERIRNGTTLKPPPAAPQHIEPTKPWPKS